jgi:hypothetical protein
MEPLLDIVEGFIVSHVIDNDDAMSSSVVGRGDGAETLLPRSIPDLELDCLTVELDRADFLQRRKKVTREKKVVSVNDFQASLGSRTIGLALFA